MTVETAPPAAGFRDGDLPGAGARRHESGVCYGEWVRAPPICLPTSPIAALPLCRCRFVKVWCMHRAAFVAGGKWHRGSVEGLALVRQPSGACHVATCGSECSVVVTELLPGSHEEGVSASAGEGEEPALAQFLDAPRDAAVWGARMRTGAD